MDAITIAKFGFYGTKTIFNNFIHPNINKQILDPLSCIIRLSLLNFKEKGTKISIANNRIYYQPPNLLQGPVRWTYGDNRNDLHNLCNPLERAIEWFNPNEDIHIYNIFNCSIKGLKKLKQSYIEKNNKVGDSNLVCHSISHYITILQNRIVSNEPTLQQHNTGYENSQLKNLWKPKEIEILDNLLTFAYEKKKADEEYTYLINAIESILQDKDEKVFRIVMQISTSL